MGDDSQVSSFLRRAALATAAVTLLTSCGPAQPPASPRPSTPQNPTASESASSLPRLATSEDKDTSKGKHDAEGLWAAVDLSEEEGLPPDPADLLEQQRAWRRAIEHDFPPGGDITCDPRTFVPLRSSILMTVGVTGPDPTLLQSPDPVALKQALSRAGQRIMLVTEAGRELTPKQFDELLDSGEEVYTPSFVSDPESYTGVVGINNIDTDGVRHTWLLRTALRIVAEEIRRVGAVPARIVPYLDVDTLEWLKDQGERLPTEAELR